MAEYFYQEDSSSIPGFSYIKNFHNYTLPANENDTEPSLLTQNKYKRQFPYEEQNQSKLKRLETEAAEFCEKLVAADVLNPDKFVPNKNDVTFYATLENHIVTNTGDTDNNQVDVADESFSVRESVGLYQSSSEVSNSVDFEITGNYTDSVSVDSDQYNATLSQNLANAEESLTAAYNSHSFSHLFVNSTEFEPKLYASTSVHAKEQNLQDEITSAGSVSSTNTSDHIIHGENEASECEDSNFAMVYNTNDTNTTMQFAYDETYNFQSLIETVTPINKSDIKDDGIGEGQATVKTENMNMQQEESFMDNMLLGVDVSHNEENIVDNVVDGHALRNWLESYVEQREVIQNGNKEILNSVSAEIMNGGTQNNTPLEKNVLSTVLTTQETRKDLSVGDENIAAYKEVPSVSLQGRDNSSNITSNRTEDNLSLSVIQCPYAKFLDTSAVQKVEESAYLGNNLHGGASTSTANVEVSSASFQHSDNKLQSGPNKIIRTTSVIQSTDSHCKHHKKELLRKFSTALENKKNNVDETLPSTSTVVNEGMPVDDCIVISDSEESVLELEIIRARPKAYNMQNLDKKSRASNECIFVSDGEEDNSPQNSVFVNNSNGPEGSNGPEASNGLEGSNGPESQGVIDLSNGIKNTHDNDTVNEGNINFVTTGYSGPMDLSRNAFAQNFYTVPSTYNVNNYYTLPNPYNAIQENGWLFAANVLDLSRRNLAQVSAASEIHRRRVGFNVADLLGDIITKDEENGDTDEEPEEEEYEDDTDDPSEPSCPICLESLFSGQPISTTPCGHLFCTECIEPAIEQFKKCPTCCRKVSRKRVHRIYL